MSHSRKLLIRFSPPVLISKSTLGHPAVGQRGCEFGLIYFFGVESALDGLQRELASGLRQIPTTAVCDGDDEIHARVVARRDLRGLRRGAQTRVQGMQIADEAQANPIRVQLGDLALERIDEQRHQAPHFLHGPPPVLAREREQREHLHARFCTTLDGGPHRLDAGLVARLARQRAAARPAAIAVHDDGDVPGRELSVLGLAGLATIIGRISGSIRIP